ncbi:LOW QUALITY PROTEIN: dynein axonemal assembly factor 8-like [Phaethornis superciliosus]
MSGTFGTDYILAAEPKVKSKEDVSVGGKTLSPSSARAEADEEKVNLQNMVLSPPEMLFSTTKGGDNSWQRNLDTLMPNPVLVCALKETETGKATEEPELEIEIRHEQLWVSLVCFVTGAWILCTLLLIKPGAWSHNLARILQKPDLEKFSVAGMKGRNLDPCRLYDSFLPKGNSSVPGKCLSLRKGVFKNPFYLQNLSSKKRETFTFKLSRKSVILARIIIWGSKSYQIVVWDMKLLFPRGLLCQTVEEEEVCNLKRDPIASLEISKQCKMIKHEAGRQLSLLGSKQPYRLDRPWLITSAKLLQSSEHPPYVNLLGKFIGKDFLVTGVYLTLLDQPQAPCIFETLSRAKCCVAAKCSLLMDGLCLALSAQDNAVICFSSLLDRVCWQKQSILDTLRDLLYAQNEKQASREVYVYEYVSSVSL